MPSIDYFDMQKSLAGLLEEHPFLKSATLTRSILGRKIPLITLGEGKRAVLYVGAHHGTEGVTTSVLLDFIADYLRQYGKRATVFEYPTDYLFRERKIYIVPMLNPDGVEYAVHGVEKENPLRDRLLSMNRDSEDFSCWKANARGVDLNHNYDAGFREYKTRELEEGLINGAPEGYSGEFPESEPETAALCRFLSAKREEIVGVLTLLTRGEEILCSCADTLTAKTMAAGRVLSRFTGYRLVRPEGISALGSLSDWCISVLSRPAYTLRCGKSEALSLSEDQSKIYERLRRALFSFPFLV